MSLEYGDRSVGQAWAPRRVTVPQASGAAGSLHTTSEGLVCPLSEPEALTSVQQIDPCWGLAPSSTDIVFPAWPSASAPPPGKPWPRLGSTNFGDLVVARAVASPHQSRQPALAPCIRGGVA